ncbi:Insulin-like growth factor binding protein, N-terminal [Pseudocohnilembus persalinus]|uniref:Insulin-like growth factor binding protein, N-terminal n=1 Tax=Pseudocohnilembus persalinus TaxID=266149 RepID=A0A0V0R8I8_PSEPJ|nr:Insulin-like growth factor binding protein, N-terminal [Pseudocohnilembus persalinus]|eukprot:KRX10793.1 Insulin-like growth factor binding protein, N-terminal [Pseudocohnilembus persalinus]
MNMCKVSDDSFFVIFSLSHGKIIYQDLEEEGRCLKGVYVTGVTEDLDKIEQVQNIISIDQNYDQYYPSCAYIQGTNTIKFNYVQNDGTGDVTLYSKDIDISNGNLNSGSANFIQKHNQASITYNDIAIIDDQNYAITYLVLPWNIDELQKDQELHIYFYQNSVLVNQVKIDASKQYQFVVNIELDKEQNYYIISWWEPLQTHISVYDISGNHICAVTEDSYYYPKIKVWNKEVYIFLHNNHNKLWLQKMTYSPGSCVIDNTTLTVNYDYIGSNNTIFYPQLDLRNGPKIQLNLQFIVQYHLQTLIFEVGECPAVCQTCLNDFECETCIPSLKGAPDCLSCADNHITETDGSCTSCASLYGEYCYQCDFDKCLSCVNVDFFLIPVCTETEHDNGECLYENSCQSCFSEINCKTCGPDPYTCLSCYDNYILQQGVCHSVESCNTQDADIQQIHCSECDSKTRECTECNKNKGRVLDNGECVCDSFYYEADGKEQCVSVADSTIESGFRVPSYIFMVLGFFALSPMLFVHFIETLQEVYYLKFIPIDYPLIVEKYFDLFGIYDFNFMPQISVESQNYIQAPEGFENQDRDSFFIRNFNQYIFLGFILLIIYFVLKLLYIKFYVIIEENKDISKKSNRGFDLASDTEGKTANDEDNEFEAETPVDKKNKFKSPLLVIQEEQNQEDEENQDKNKVLKSKNQKMKKSDLETQLQEKIKELEEQIENEEKEMKNIQNGNNEGVKISNFKLKKFDNFELYLHAMNQKETCSSNYSSSSESSNQTHNFQKYLINLRKKYRKKLQKAQNSQGNSLNSSQNTVQDLTIKNLLKNENPFKLVLEYILSKFEYQIFYGGIIISYLSFMVASQLGMYFLSFYSTLTIASTFFAFIFLLLGIIMPFSVYRITKNISLLHRVILKEEENEKGSKNLKQLKSEMEKQLKKNGVLYDALNLNQTKTATFFVWILVKKIIYSLALITLNKYPIAIQIIFIIFYSIQTGYVLKCQPFKKQFQNIKEIFQGVLFTSLLISTLSINVSDNKDENARQTSTMTLIIIATLIVVIEVLVIIQKIILKLKKIIMKEDEGLTKEKLKNKLNAGKSKSNSGGSGKSNSGKSDKSKNSKHSRKSAKNKSSSEEEKKKCTPPQSIYQLNVKDYVKEEVKKDKQVSNKKENLGVQQNGQFLEPPKKLWQVQNYSSSEAEQSENENRFKKAPSYQIKLPQQENERYKQQFVSNSESDQNQNYNQNLDKNQNSNSKQQDNNFEGNENYKNKQKQQFLQAPNKSDWEVKIYSSSEAEQSGAENFQNQMRRRISNSNIKLPPLQSPKNEVIN